MLGVGVGLTESATILGRRAANIYNWVPGTNLTHYRAKLAQVKGGTARGTIAFYGDSTTLGWGAGTGGLAYPGAHDLAVSSRFAAYLAASALPTTINSQLAGFGGGSNTAAILKSYNSRISFTGTGWVPNLPISSQSDTAGGAFLENTTTTADLLSFTPVGSVDTVKVLYFINTPLGSFSWNIDGGADTTVSESAPAATGIVTIPVARGSHTVNIKRVSGAVYMIGFIAYDSTATAFDIMNFGWGGSQSGDWNNSTLSFSPLGAINFYAADLAFINLGINDWEAGTSTSTFSTNIQALITAQKAVGDCILVSPNRTGGTASESVQATYVAMLKALSNSNNIPLIDLWARDGTYASQNAAGHMFDTLHPKASLYDAEAAFIASFVNQLN